MPVDQSLAVPLTLLLRHAGGQVEELPLEEYVKGVLPALLPLPAPPEALKAAAIAVRSDAAVTRRHARDPFDLCAAAHCQAWQPAGRTPDTDRAAGETSGLVLTLNNRIVSAPTFEACDGHTRNSEEVWAGRMAHCRSVACACGSTALSGHGVGLCLRGAVVLARHGATAEAILNHYYAHTFVARAAAVPRAALRQGLILGCVVDGAGRPLPGARLLLSGSGGALDAAPTADGRFWFSGLGSGEWELRVKGKPVRYAGLRTDGRSTLEVQVVVPDAPPLAPETIPLAHPKRLIGTLGYAGVPVTIVDAHGREQTVTSGSAPEYDPGGFSIPLPPPGRCTFRFLDQTCAIDVGPSGVWVRFVPCG